jgi:hypothetical protein
MIRARRREKEKCEASALFSFQNASIWIEGFPIRPWRQRGRFQ